MLVSLLLTVWCLLLIVESYIMSCRYSISSCSNSSYDRQSFYEFIMFPIVVRCKCIFHRFTATYPLERDIPIDLGLPLLYWMPPPVGGGGDPVRILWQRLVPRKWTWIFRRFDFWYNTTLSQTDRRADRMLYHISRVASMNEWMRTHYKNLQTALTSQQRIEHVELFII